jgi:hypothetical protein
MLTLLCAMLGAIFHGLDACRFHKALREFCRK